MSSTGRTRCVTCGALTRDFLLGRRRKQLGPVQLFVICNVVNFFLQPFPLFVPFTSTLQIQTHERVWSGIATRMVDAKLADHGVTFDAYARTYDEAAHLQGKTLVMIMVPPTQRGQPLRLIARRQPKQEHVHDQRHEI